MTTESDHQSNGGLFGGEVSGIQQGIAGCWVAIHVLRPGGEDNLDSIRHELVDHGAIDARDVRGTSALENDPRGGGERGPRDRANFEQDHVQV